MLAALPPLTWPLPGLPLAALCWSSATVSWSGSDRKGRRRGLSFQHAAHLEQGNRQGAERDQPGAKAHLGADQPALLECLLSDRPGDEVGCGGHVSSSPTCRALVCRPSIPTMTAARRPAVPAVTETACCLAPAPTRPARRAAPAAAVWLGSGLGHRSACVLPSGGHSVRSDRDEGGLQVPWYLLLNGTEPKWRLHDTVDSADLEKSLARVMDNGVITYTLASRNEGETFQSLTINGKHLVTYVITKEADPDPAKTRSRYEAAGF